MDGEDGFFIVAYSREDAIAEGEQVRCPDEIRNEAGIKFPVFFTRSVWENYIQVPKGFEGIQDLNGRLWDTLFMWVWSVKRQRPKGQTFDYKVVFTTPRKADGEPYQKTVTFRSQIGATDHNDPAPAITIMLPGEE